MSKICYCYRLFINSLLLVFILRSDPVVAIVLDKNVINIAFLNYYSWEIDKYWFCYLCFNILKQEKAPKFSFVKKVNVIICQDYLPILKVFTLVKKILIAQCYPVMLTFKLRPNRALLLITYQYVHNHIVVFS